MKDVFIKEALTCQSELSLNCKWWQFKRKRKLQYRINIALINTLNKVK